MSERSGTYPYAGDDPERSDRQEEDPGNFKRTPTASEVERDPLDSGRHLNSNMVLVAAAILSLIGAVLLALIVL